MFSITLFVVTILFVARHVEGREFPSGRITNGYEANLAQSMHQVSIRNVRTDRYYFGGGHLCGGSLVASNVVISAAHCFVDYQDVLNRGNFRGKDDFTIVMGNLNRFRRNNDTLQFGIKELILGVQRFNLSSYNFDIAVVILNGTVPADHPTIKPIALNSGSIANGTLCTATGWGTTETGASSSVLMAVDIPWLDDEFCLSNSRIPANRLLPGMTCAGYVFEGQKDACSGDSGGPLVCNKLLAGIVSWGYDCARPMMPGIYTDVQYYLPWVNEKLRAYNLSVTAENVSPPASGTTSSTLSTLLIFTTILAFISNSLSQ